VSDQQPTDRPRAGNRRRMATVLILVLAAAALVLLTATLSVAFIDNQSEGDRLDHMDTEQLEAEKLRVEIRHVEGQDGFWRGVLPAYAGFLTALGAIVGLVITALRNIDERTKQQQEMLNQHQQELRQREDDLYERKRDVSQRFEQSFAASVSNLGSDRRPIRVSGAVALLTFLREDFRDFHEQVFLLALAQLKIESDEDVRRLLVRALGQSARKILPTLREGDRPSLLDFTRANLPRIDLSGELDLHGIDLAFAICPEANFSGANMRGAKGQETDFTKARFSGSNLETARMNKATCVQAQFHNATLTSAQFKEGADFTGAEFQGARMQHAHLEDSVLVGASFEEAVLTSTYFYGGKFDDRALGSLARNTTWESAKFDSDDRAKLEVLAARQGHARESDGAEEVGTDSNDSRRR
jgi:uncharacterized protein YjbI with pentapeptide repeats